MAKKTETKTRIFDTNPSLDVVYKTADENYFYLESDAKNHAQNLKDKNVQKVINPSKTPLEVVEQSDENGQPENETENTENIV